MFFKVTTAGLPEGVTKHKGVKRLGSGSVAGYDEWKEDLHWDERDGQESKSIFRDTNFCQLQDGKGVRSSKPNLGTEMR